MARCPSCNFLPLSDEDKAKSLILSLDYEIEGEYYGKTKEELKAIASSIQGGTPYLFDKEEIQKIVSYASQVASIPVRRLVFDGLKWIGPPIVILVVVYLLLFLKR